MRLIALGAWLVMTGLTAVWTAPAAAQEAVAEVRTWSGQSWRLSQSSLEVFYSIVPPKKDDDSGAPPSSVGMTGTGQTRFAGVSIFGSVASLNSLFDKGPDPRQGHRQVQALRLYQGGIETQVPVASIATLAFSRAPVANSTLPPYVAVRHFRHGATATLIDGSRVEADYVNFGTLLLRGQTAQGRVDIPWDDIEVVRFVR